MKTFKQFLQEAISSDKNIHLQHVEDLPIFEGQDGLKKAVLYLNHIVKQLSGEEVKNIQIKTKIDGAPAIFAGIDPEKKEFFVSTKAIFNKLEPKVNYTEKDINKHYSDQPGLVKKLKAALKYLPELGIKDVLQGDMLYTHDELKKKKIEGKEYITFRPNTITYAVPTDSPLAKEILDSKMGIIFHTEYKGPSFSSLKASYKTDLSHLKKSRNVFYRDADFENVGKSAAGDKNKLAAIQKKEKTVQALAKGIDNTFLDKLEHDKDLQTLVSTYINFLVRKGETTKTESEKIKEFSQFVNDKFQGEIDILKTERGKENRKKKLDYIQNILTHNTESLTAFFKLHNAIIDLKLNIIDVLNQMQKSVETFLDKDGNLERTNPEGAVVVSDAGAVKLVDRDNFSRANFTLPKTWDKGE